MDLSKSCKKNIEILILLLVIVLVTSSLLVIGTNYVPKTKLSNTYGVVKIKDSVLPPGSVYVNIANTNSMEPTLDSNNKVICELNPESIRIGDIIVFTDYDNDYVIHRVIKVFHDGYQTKGDNNLVVDKKISKDKVYCKVNTILF